MSEPASEVNEAVCWKCGAPAYGGGIVRLASPACKHRDAQGHHVSRGRWQDVVDVRIPLCKGCCNRGFLGDLLICVTCIAGMVLGFREWPSGVMPVVLPFVGFIVGLFCRDLHERFSGRRSISTYPPLLRLRQAGWSDED